ncbi:MAG: serine hydrolase domain-containing protein [Gammaproteobacteria bacterium]|nr:serine hydrolase domain-containing protein [Gammaproteobacteria bacterium]
MGNLAGAILTALAMGLIQPACATPGSDAASAWQKLHQELIAMQQANGVPVLVLAILDEGRPVLVRMTGFQRQQGSTSAMDPHTTFRWGSISKTVTALMLLEAMRHHSAAPDTPVAEILHEPPYRNPWAPEQPVRLDHLLELSAGLPDLKAEEFNDNEPLPLAAALDRYAGQRRLLWPPGLQHSYSNVIPGITAAVVAELTGRTFDQAAETLVFAPLGMEGASFQPVEGLPGGFKADGRTAIPYWHMTFRAFGALNAAPAAMVRLLEALLNHGRVNGRQAVAAASVNRMYRIEATLGGEAGLEIGYGAGIYGWVRDGHLWHGHGGDADGYRSRFGVLREAGRGYLVGINVDDPGLLRRMQRRIEATLTADLQTPRPPPEAAVDDDALHSLAGEYYPASVRFGVERWQSGRAGTIKLSVADGQLVYQGTQTRGTLLPLGQRRFRRPADPAVSVVFAEFDDRLYLQGELGNYARIDPPPYPEFMPACRNRWPLPEPFGMVGAAR